MHNYKAPFHNLSRQFHSRLGGTAADLLYFKEQLPRNFYYKNSPETTGNNSTNCWCANDEKGHKVCEDLESFLYKNRTAFPMSGQDWIDINQFASKAGWTFLFDFNVLLRSKKNDKWSLSNAKKLLKFSSQHKFNGLWFELGNEPNSLKHQLGFQISGRRLGRDFKRLRKLLDRFQLYKNSSLVGPDVNQLRAQGPGSKVQKALKYLGDVVQGSKINDQSVLDALTWHHYYLNGHTATFQDFLDAKVLDNLSKMFETVQRFLEQKRINKPLWLGETSSAYGGGAHGLSDR